MACHTFSDDDFSCSVCCDIFIDPVVLSCSHTFCRVCVTQSWQEKRARECPICRKISKTADPPCNRVMKNLCEALLKERSQKTLQGSEIRCNLHNEKFKLFCLDDQKPLCVVCRDSNKHKTHSCRAAEEAAADLKVRPLMFMNCSHKWSRMHTYVLCKVFVLNQIILVIQGGAQIQADASTGEVKSI